MNGLTTAAQIDGLRSDPSLIAAVLARKSVP
jgi:hypothetical protein